MLEPRDGRHEAAHAAGSRAESRPLRGPGGRPAGSHSLDLDRVIHERVRLGIVSALAVNASLSFNDLKKLLQTTDGNLSVHARKLEEAGYVTCSKGFEGRIPRSDYRLTARGRKALARYLEQMEDLIRRTKD